ncbi:MAG: D-cysteine desulfhydrase [Candidatus Bathyarchaeota archaeon]|nr:D-cysteine desulfhydrase [Candidatus Bathyarchaeota archaeon]
MKKIADLQKRINKLPRIKLARLPTPLEEMPNLTKALGGPKLWIKRDDLTGIAFGGNKERKTEFVVADAIQKGADALITTGAVQSNHARVTAAAAKKLGLKVVLVLRGTEPQEYDGNLLLDNLFGADIRFVQMDSQQALPAMEKVAEELKRKGHKPYIVPGGASYPIGAVGYVNTMLELINQAEEANLNINYIFHASGSGGTQAGLVTAKKALEAEIEILGICIKPNANQWLTEKIVKIANGIAKLLDLKEVVNRKDVVLIGDYAGEAHGVPTPEAVEAIKLVAQTEGILLDPVYTGKAMAGLIDLIKKEHFKKDDNVVFIHTGGTPALFAYRKHFKT